MLPELPQDMPPEERERIQNLAIDTEMFEQMATQQAEKPVKFPFNLFSSNKKPKNPSPDSH